MWFSHSFFINTVRLFPMDKYLVFLLYNQSKHYRFIFPNDARKTCYLSRSEKCPLKHLDILITSQSTFERKKSLSNNNKNNNITTTQLKKRQQKLSVHFVQVVANAFSGIWHFTANPLPIWLLRLNIRACFPKPLSCYLQMINIFDTHQLSVCLPILNKWTPPYSIGDLSFEILAPFRSVY